MTRQFSIVLMLVGILAAVALSYQRNDIYGSYFSLWQDVVAKNPRQARAHNNLGNSYLLKGMLEEAIREYRITLELDRFYVQAYFNMGIALEDTGHPEEAIYYYGIFCKDALGDMRRYVACERYQVLTETIKKPDGR